MRAASLHRGPRGGKPASRECFSCAPHEPSRVSEGAEVPRGALDGTRVLLPPRERPRNSLDRSPVSTQIRMEYCTPQGLAPISSTVDVEPETPRRSTVLTRTSPRSRPAPAVPSPGLTLRLVTSSLRHEPTNLSRPGLAGAVQPRPGGVSRPGVRCGAARGC